MAGETIELLVKTILQADPSQQLAAISEVDAAIQKLGSDAAKVSSGGGGNYNRIVEQAIQFETHIKAGVAALRTAGINPQVINSLEKLQGTATANLTSNIANPATRKEVATRVATGLAGENAPEYQKALTRLTTAARKSERLLESGTATQAELAAADKGLARARENLSAVINKEAVEVATTTKTIKGTTVYHGTQNALERPVPGGKTAHYSQEFGSGFYVSPDADVANQFAGAGGINSNPGIYRGVLPDSVRILDLAKKLPANVRKIFEEANAALQSNARVAGGFKQKDPQEAVSTLFSRYPPGGDAEIIDKLKGLGYGGISGKIQYGSGVGPNALSDSRQINVFDSESVLGPAEAANIASLEDDTQSNKESAAAKRKSTAATTENTAATKEDTQKTRRASARKSEAAARPGPLGRLAQAEDTPEARQAAAEQFYAQRLAGTGGGGKPPRITDPPLPPEEPPDDETGDQKKRRQALRQAYLRRVNAEEKKAQDAAENAALFKAEGEAALAAQKASDEAIKIENAKRVQAVKERATGKRPPGSPQQLSEPVLSAFSEKVVTAEDQAGVQEQLADPESGYTQAVARVRLALQQQSALIEQHLLTLTGVNEEEGAYAKALADTRVAQAKTNAEVNKRLAAEGSYAQALAENKTAQRQVKAKTEQLLAADNAYIEATAEIANARRTMAALSKSKELSGVGFEKTSALGVRYGDEGIGISDAERERRRALGVQQITELEGATKATADYRKMQTELATAVERQAIDARARVTPGASTEAVLTTQRRAIEAALAAQLEKQLSTDKLYQKNAAELAVVKKVRAAQEKATLESELAVNNEYLLAQAEVNNARRQQAAEIKARELEGVGLRPDLVLPDGTKIKASEEARKGDLDALRRLEASNIHNAELAQARVQSERQKLKYSDTEEQEIANAAIGQRRYNEAQRVRIATLQRQAHEQRVRAGAPTEEVGTVFQRLQSQIGGRDKGDFKDPLQYAQLGQFLKSKFLTTAGFAVSGAITYAAFAGISKMATDSANLERILAQVRAQFEALGEGDAAEGFIEGIKDISRASGEAAADVANIAFQFKGAFDGKTNAAVLEEAESAVKISRVTGLSLAEVTDSLTSTALNYGVSVERVGDTALALQDRTGVLAKHIITAVADLAPVAEEVGLKLEQVGAIAAVAQKKSGQTGAVLAESLNRILPTIGENSGELIQFFRQNRPSGEADEVLNALATGQTGAVFDLIGKKYADLTESQQKYVQSLLGTKKDLKGLIPVLNSYGEVVDLVTVAKESSGRLDQSYAALQQTLAQQLQRVAAAFKNIGQAILSLGVSEAIQNLAKVLGLVVVVVSDFVSIFATVNDVLGGMPSKIAAVVVSYLLLAKVLKTINELGFASAVGRIAQLPVSKVPSAIGGISRRNVAADVATGAAASGAFIGGRPHPNDVDAAAKARDQAIKGGNRVTNAVGNFGVGLERKGIEAGGKIGTAQQRIGRALTSFGASINALLPILAIVASVAFFNSIIDGFTKTKQKIDDLALVSIEQGGFDTEEGTKSIQEYHDARAKALDPGHNLNPLKLFSGDGELARFGGIVAASTTKDASEVGRDAVQKQTTKAFATVLKTNFKEDQLKTILASAGEDPTFGKGGPFGTLSVEDIDDIAKKGTTDNKEFLAVLDAFTKSSELKKELGKAYQSLIGDAKEAEEKKAKLDANLDSLPTLLIKSDIGAITPGEFQSKATELRDGLIEALNLAIEKRSDPELIKSLKAQLDGVDQALEQSLSSFLNNQVATRTAINDLRGSSQLDTLKATIRVNEGALSVPGALTSTVGPQLANAAVQAQKSLVQYMLDHAATNAEAAKIMREGIKIPENVANELEIQNLKSGIPSNLTQILSHSAAALNRNFDQVLQEIVTAKGGIRAGIQALIDELIDEINKLKLQGKGGSQRVKNLTAHVAGLRREKATYAGAEVTNVYATPVEPSTPDQEAEAFAQYQAAQTQDPVALALLARQEAERKLGLANKAGSPTNTKAGRIAALQGIAEADKQYKEAMEGEAQARLDLLAAMAEGDPVAVAQINIQKANLAIQQAKGKGFAAEAAAQAQLISANREYEAAIREISNANFAVLTAMADGDQLAIAQIALAQANDQAARAKSEAERINAFAAQISAQNQIRDAIFAIADAQSNLLIAIATAAGDTVGAAKLALQNAKDVLARDLARGLSKDDPRVIADRQRVVESEAALRDATLNDATSDINFLLSTHKISNAQAISRLKILDQNQKLTKQEHQQLQQQIYDLEHQAQQDLQFNLPSDIKLPTLYEARRFNESGGGAGGSNYQDNRKIDIRISTNAKLDGKDVEVLVSGITDAISAPPRYGNRARTY